MAPATETFFAVTATAERGVGGKPENADRGVGNALATEGFVDLDTPSDVRAAGDERALSGITEGAGRESWTSFCCVAGETDGLIAGTEGAGDAAAIGDGKTPVGPDSTDRGNCGDAAAADRSCGGARATRVGCMRGLAMRETADDGAESKYRGRKAGDTDRLTTYVRGIA